MNAIIFFIHKRFRITNIQYFRFNAAQIDQLLTDFLPGFSIPYEISLDLTRSWLKLNYSYRMICLVFGIS
jgi:hypothetical protein